MHERLGDMRSRAVTQGRIADILQARGEFDEALRIRVEEELPVYERLGRRAFARRCPREDSGHPSGAGRVRRSTARPGRGGATGVRAPRGHALARRHPREDSGHPSGSRRVRRGATHPGRGRASGVRALGRRAFARRCPRADIHQARGEFGEALRVRVEEELPVYERLGDVRSRATALGKVADILRARGELDEALRIYEQDVLPEIERIGNPTEIQWVRGRISFLRSLRVDAISR